MPPNYRKRRKPHGPSKNELRSARNERAQLEKENAGTLRQRFPRVDRLQMDLRLETPTGGVMDTSSRIVDPDEPLQLDILCPSTCGDGRFDLMDTVEKLLNASEETYEGLSICQTPSYADPRFPCGTKLYYHISIQYKGE